MTSASAPAPDPATDPATGPAPRVALALGSGGARGYAHIGVIEVLAERGYEIVDVAGTSMGALVGGLHAAGSLPAFTEWARSLTSRELLRLLDPSLRAPGAIRAEKVLGAVSELLDGALIEDLPIRFTAVATDLLARKEVWFQEGPVAAAIRASIALPSFITPVVINGRLLADGGLMNPLPIAATLATHADLTLAVTLSGDDDGESVGRAPVSASSAPQPREVWGERFRRSLAARTADWLERDTVKERLPWLVERGGSWQWLQDGNGTADGDPTDPANAGDTQVSALPAYDSLPRGIGTLEVMELSLDALQSVLARYRLASYPPDLLVTVPKSAAKVLEFHRAEELIEVGRARAVEVLDDYETSQMRAKGRASSSS